MNDELQKLLELYETMVTNAVDAGEWAQTTNVFDKATRQAALRHRVDVRQLRNHVKGLYYERVRAEERRRGLPPPPRSA